MLKTEYKKVGSSRGRIFIEYGRSRRSEIKILTSKLISDIKSLCKDRFEKEGNDLGKGSCKVV